MKLNIKENKTSTDVFVQLCHVCGKAIKAGSTLTLDLNKGTASHKECSYDNKTI